MRRLAILALVMLAGCHRPHADQPTPGADGEAQAATANKTLADLQAADDAARGPAPTIAPVVHHDEKPAAKPAKIEAAAPADDTTALPTEGNQTR